MVGSLREGGKGKGKIGVGDCWEGGFIKGSLRRILAVKSEGLGRGMMPPF